MAIGEKDLNSLRLDKIITEHMTEPCHGISSMLKF